jgi:alpha-ketoglutaric semialdehyde dehydrogenase
MSTALPILFGSNWTDEPSFADTIKPVNPADGIALRDSYPVSTSDTLSRMASHAKKAAEELNQTPPDQIAMFLDTHAGLIDERRASIADIAHAETGLPRSPRLVQVEMDRTIDQLRQTAECVRSRDWVCARIDTTHNLRSMYEPLGGGVLTIGPNNFPLAYNGIAGGDFAAAIAARNPVIAKAHPLHPGTSRQLAQCAHDAATTTNLPQGSVQLFYHCSPEDGLDLIRNPSISAVGFTGSRRAGLALKQAADETGKPIYLELSSINPMFLMDQAVRQRGLDIADQIAESMLAASGQQCTCPGLIVVRAGEDAEAFVDRLRTRLDAAEPQVMLSHGGRDALHRSILQNIKRGATCETGGKPVDGDIARYQHSLMRVDAMHFLNNHAAFQEEMFGVAALLVTCESTMQFAAIAQHLEGNLTGTIHHEESDYEAVMTLTRSLRPQVGRLIHNGVPTGVHVNPATVHGGPFPATGHPGFTAVGMPTSIHRFSALRCYDRADQRYLPPELRDMNPTGEMMRCIDTEWTTRSIGP